MDMDVKEPRGIIQNRYFAKRIVIIGAGVSGLSAASELQKLGFENVVVLEARNTTGGRVQTVHFGSDFVEIGAEWIHGHEGNRMYEIARDHDLIEEDCPDYLEALLIKWSNVADEEQREAISSTVTMLEKAMDKMNSCEPSALPKSLKEYLSNNFESYLLSCSDSHLIKLIKQAAYDWFVKLQFELNGCRSLSDVSCKLLLNFKECEGCQVTELKSGYSSVLNVLCKNIPESWIKKNREVKTVVWKNVSGGTSELDEKMGELQLSNSDEVKSHAVSIHCVNGEVYVADHVIVTIPLGYLKKSHDSLFIPPLPSDKVNAIQCIGFHALNKIFLEFEEPFWEKPSVFNMLWINEDFQSLVDNGSFHQCLEASWHKFISRFAYVSHHPRMLCAWIVGDGAVIMEGLPEKQVLKECHELLQQQLGRIDIPFPRRIIRSKWGTDPYTHGSYSYLSVNCEEAGVTNEELASPITREFDSSPLLQFAGEATHSSFYSTVHGAYESGIREAQRIFNYYRYHNYHDQNGIVHGIPFKQKCEPLVYHHHFLSTADIQEKPRVVIIGAGAAGLSCAQRLSLNGFDNLVVLEAQGREGGRIHTQQYGDSVLELGAQWVHGEECNPLYEFCESHGLLSNPVVDFSVEGKGHFCTSLGDILNEQLVDEVIMVLERIKETISSHNYPHTKSLQPVTSVFERGFANYLSSCFDSPSMVSIKKGIFDWYLRFEVIDNACDNLEEISTLGYAEWTECPGVYHINFKNGFEDFIRELCKCLPLDTIKYRKAVTCVHWKKSLVPAQIDGNNLMAKPLEFYPVSVECSDGDIIGADSVIVTPSIGYLASNLINFFQPQLPRKKTTAIQNSGFGTINKIYLLFDKPFWSKHDLGFQLVWTESEDELLVQNSWIRGISGFDTVWKQPNVLVGWIGGPEAVQMEKIPSEKVGKTCVEILRRFLNKKDIPYPIQVVRSTWNSNSYIKGSYSSRPQKFFDAGCHVSDLTEPLYCSYVSNSGNIIEWPAVMFAGEATDPEYFSSVHGAMRSGWREADRLIQCCRGIYETSHGKYFTGSRV